MCFVVILYPLLGFVRATWRAHASVGGETHSFHLRAALRSHSPTSQRESGLFKFLRRRLHLNIVKTVDLDASKSYVCSCAELVFVSCKTSINRYIFGVHPHAVLPFGGMLAMGDQLEDGQPTFQVWSCYYFPHSGGTNSSSTGPLSWCSLPHPCCYVLLLHPAVSRPAPSWR